MSRLATSIYDPYPDIYPDFLTEMRGEEDDEGKKRNTVRVISILYILQNHITYCFSAC